MLALRRLLGTWTSVALLVASTGATSRTNQLAIGNDRSLAARQGIDLEWIPLRYIVAAQRANDARRPLQLVLVSDLPADSASALVRRLHALGLPVVSQPKPPRADTLLIRFGRVGRGRAPGEYSMLIEYSSCEARRARATEFVLSFRCSDFACGDWSLALLPTGDRELGPCT